MPQDDTREKHLTKLFELDAGDENRIGVDAFLDGIHFELKSSTRKDGISTARDLGIHTLEEKYYKRHWLIAKYAKDEVTIEDIYYLTPNQARLAFKPIHQYLEDMTKTADFIRRITKKSAYHSKHEKKIEQILKRGITYNDPTLTWTRIRKYGKKVRPKPSYAEWLRNELKKTI